MSRLLVAAAVALTGFIALPKEANPEVTVTAPTLTRPIPLRASRSVRRHPLPHPRRRHRRPVVTPTPTPTATPTPTPAAPVAAAHDWSGVAACESGGDWHINTGNSFYGGLQFMEQSWVAMGGLAYAPRPDLASEAAQITVAERLLAAQGPGAWPICSRYLAAS